MKNLFIILLALSLTVGCQKSSEPDPASTTSALQETAETDEANADDSSDASTNEGDENQEGAEKAADLEGADDADAEDSADEDADTPSSVLLDHDVTLTSAGSKPRRSLVFDLDKLKPISVQARTEIESSTQGMNIIIPRVTQSMTVTKLERDDDTLSVTIKSSKPSYESRADDEMHKMLLASMREAEEVGAIEFSFDMDALGNVSNSKIIDAGGSSEDAMMAMTGQLRQFASNYPAEPVGKGATWTSTSRVDVGGSFVLDTIVHYTLTELTDNGAVIDMTYEIPDVADSINKAGDVGEGEPQVTEASMRGEGTLSVDLRRLLPTIDQNIVLDMTLEQDGQPLQSTLKMRTQIVPLD